MTTEPLKEKNRHKDNVTCPMSHLVTGQLFSFYPLLLSEQRKKKKSGGRGGRISDTWSVKIPVTVDLGQSPTKSTLFKLDQRRPTFQQYTCNPRYSTEGSVLLWSTGFNSSFVTCQHSRWAQPSTGGGGGGRHCGGSHPTFHKLPLSLPSPLWLKPVKEQGQSLINSFQVSQWKIPTQSSNYNLNGAMVELWLWFKMAPLGKGMQAQIGYEEEFPYSQG